MRSALVIVLLLVVVAGYYGYVSRDGNRPTASKIEESTPQSKNLPDIQPRLPQPVTRERALGAADDTDNWLLYGRTYAEDRFSPLDQINDKNVDQLGLAWAADILSIDGIAATPLVIDGVVYMSSTFANVIALDATTGETRWAYDPQVRLDASLGSSWAARVNRGVAAWRDKIYVGTGDCRLIALDAGTGTPIWETLTCDPEQEYGITGAPRVANDKVYIGNLGADFATRGYVSAYDAATGKLVWRFYTVPGDPAKGFESPAMEMAAKTWTGEAWWQSGGGNAWDTIVYDPEFNHLYFGTDSALPWNAAVRSPEGGDNLFLNSIVAVDADTGEYRWHYQTVPADAWDYNATMQMILTEFEIGGTVRKVLLQAPKNGFFYVIERGTGKLLSAEKYTTANWASHIDLETGRPVETPTARYYRNIDKTAFIFPSAWGGHNWQSMSYHPETGLVYIPAIDMPTTYSAKRDNLLGGVQVNLTGIDPDDPRRPEIMGRLLAWDPRTQSARWSVDYELPVHGGTLATGGNLVFQGTADGEFIAYAAATGKRLWSAHTGSATQAAPVTYRYESEQYVLVPVGSSGAARSILTEYGAGKSARGPSRLLSFKLGGDKEIPTATLLAQTMPEPPEGNISQETIRKGKQVYDEMSCGLCHGANVIAHPGGSVPDLRYLTKEKHAEWDAIVLHGTREQMGMLSFGDYLSEEDSAAVQAYVIDKARAGYEAAGAQ